jgi:hypothetical protein
VLAPIMVLVSNIGAYLRTSFPHRPSNLFISAIGSVFFRQFAAININPWAPTPTSHMIIYLSFSVSLNALLSGLIVTHLFRKGKATGAAGSSSKFAELYSRIVRMFVESFLLYATTALVFIGLCVERSFGQNIIFPVLGQMQVRSTRC